MDDKPLNSSVVRVRRNGHRPSRSKRSGTTPITELAERLACVGQAVRATGVYALIESLPNFSKRAGSTSRPVCCGWSLTRGVTTNVDPKTLETLRCEAHRIRSPKHLLKQAPFSQDPSDSTDRVEAILLAAWDPDDPWGRDKNVFTAATVLGRLALEATAIRRDDDFRERARLIEEEPDIALICTLDGSVTHANASAAELLGMPDRHALVGRPINDLVSEGDRYRLRRHLRSVEVERRGDFLSGADFRPHEGPYPAIVHTLPLSLSPLPRLVSALVPRAPEPQRSNDMRLLHELERQRQEIGLELHDGIGQLLTALRISAHNLVALADKLEEPFGEECHRLSLLADEALMTLRNASSELSPPALLRGDSLRDSLKILIERTRQIAQIQCSLSFVGRVEIDDPDCRVHVYRIIQEALTNAVKHACAGKIHVVVERAAEAEAITIEVMDDGVGLQGKPSKSMTVGMESMKRRAAMIGAHLTVRSIPNRYTSVHVRVPVGRKDDLKVGRMLS